MKSVTRLSKCTNLVYPSKVFYINDLPYRLSITGSNAIKAIQKHLSPSGLKNEKSTVLDVYPGHGTLSKALLKAGLPNIHMFQKFPSDIDPTDEQLAMRSSLEKLKSAYESHVHIHECGIFRYEDHNLSEVIGKIAPCDEWPAEPPLKVILPMSPMVENRVINMLHHQIVDQSGFFTCARPQFYILMSYIQAAIIAADYRVKNYMAYRSKSVLYQTLFDVEFLEKVPWNELNPIIRRKNIKSTDDYFGDYDHAFLVRVTPKKNLPDLIPIESLQEYHFFVTQALVRRKNCLIPWFEKWFPGCGPRLIKAGIPLFSRAGDTSPQTYVSLFNLITKWPEYTTSTFKAASMSNQLVPNYIDDESEEEDVLLSNSDPIDPTEQHEQQHDSTVT